MRQVLQQQKQCGIKLRPKKCYFFKREVCYVGRVISEAGYKMNPKGVAALMGFLSYYRPYISDFSRIAKPLYELLAKPKSEQKSNQKKKSAGRRSAQLPPSKQVQWTEIHQVILNKIINQLIHPPIMA